MHITIQCTNFSGGLVVIFKSSKPNMKVFASKRIDELERKQT